MREFGCFYPFVQHGSPYELYITGTYRVLGKYVPDMSPDTMVDVDISDVRLMLANGTPCNVSILKMIQYFQWDDEQLQGAAEHHCVGLIAPKEPDYTMEKQDQ